MRWLEWPAAVTAAAPGKLLAQIYTDFCSDQVITITANATEVIVDGRSTPRGQICPLAIPAFPSDTLLPLPLLVAPAGQTTAYYVIRATLLSARGEVISRIAGPITLAESPDTTRYMAGLGTLGPDSVGCVVLIGGVFGAAHQYAVLNPPAALAGDTVVVMAGAHVVMTPPPAACGTRRAVELDFVEAALVP